MTPTRRADAPAIPPGLVAPQSPDTLAVATVRLLMDRDRDWEAPLLAQHLEHRTEAMLAFLSRNRVLVRCLERLRQRGVELPALARDRLTGEHARIADAMQLLARITALLEELHEPFTTIKTLDQYPDQGHDVDLLTGPENPAVVAALVERLNGSVSRRSLSEVLAAKRNVRLPGDVIVELHAARLGQVGEHDRLAEAILDARRQVTVHGLRTWVPGPEGRLLLAMLQRVYRHFNFRLCDLVNLAALMQDPELNWSRLWRLAQNAGVAWGVASGLRAVHVTLQRAGLSLPQPPLPPGLQQVQPIDLFFHRDYYRFGLWQVVPRAYLRQWLKFAGRGRVAQVGRLSVLAGLMAFVGLNIRLAPSAPLWRRLW